MKHLKIVAVSKIYLAMFQLLRNLEIRVRTKLKSTKNKASGFGSGIEKISDSW